MLQLVVMERYMKEQPTVILKMHCKYKDCYVETVRKLCSIFCQQNAPNQLTVQRFIKKFQYTGPHVNIKSSRHHLANQSLEKESKRKYECHTTGIFLQTYNWQLQEHHAVNSVSDCLQDLTDTSTQANRLFEALQFC